MRIYRYLLSCFLLLIPVLLWKLIFTPYLPEVFRNADLWNNTPRLIKWGEYLLGVLVFILPFFMPLQVKSKIQRTGLSVYLTGLVVFLFAWRPLILYPDGSWSNSLMGFIVPDIALLMVFTGIGLIGKRLFFNVRYHSLVYILISFVYILFHSIHFFVVY